MFKPTGVLSMCLLAAVASAGEHEFGAEPRDFRRSAEVPVSTYKKILEATETLQYNANIADLIAGVKESDFEEYILMLSGESTNSTLTTRVSTSINDENGILYSTDYLTAKLEEFGFDVTRDTFRSDWGPNIIATLRGTGTDANALVILGAHYDSIPARGRAPGANDDGSGTAALLGMATAIAASGSKFQKTIVLEFYAGEEQGLVGSRALAAKRRGDGDVVFAQIQQDMTALKLAQDPIGLAFVQSRSATDPVLTAYVQDVSKVYADDRLTLFNSVISGSACCSDHQSYAENGFPSVGLIEPRGYTGDPQYHRIGDLVERSNYSVLQATLAARVALAAAADLAGIV